MADPTPAQRAIGDFAPTLVELTDDVLFGDVWERTDLAKRDRSLITVASLVTSSSFEQLGGHLRLAKPNGLTGSRPVLLPADKPAGARSTRP